VSLVSYFISNLHIGGDKRCHHLHLPPYPYALATAIRPAGGDQHRRLAEKSGSCGAWRRLSGPLALATLACLFMLVQGCAGLRPRQPLPAALENEARVHGFPEDVRAWSDKPSKSLTKSAVESIQEERAAYGEEILKKPVSLLALSGGGDNGAFGAGVLCGWTQHGDRPRFKLVTGISTGALIAPFAFLGSEYDANLKVYTMVTQEEIFRRKSLLTALWRESLADTRPLAQLIAKYIDASILQAVAAEHKKGRRLFIGTTQFDAQRLVIWNMGAIAASGHPEALKLFQKILLASASIPGFFPPQYFRVEAGGREYEEMHVDGGTMAQVILYEAALKPFTEMEEITEVKLTTRPRVLYIIRNGPIKPAWEKVRPRLAPIASRAINTLIKTQGVGDLYRLMAFAHRDKMDFNLAAIPGDFPSAPEDMFDQEYMNKLFDFAHETARHGYPWKKFPPFFEPESIFRAQ
jgi:predicted patatin/cPLA2 family phospholipase